MIRAGHAIGVVIAAAVPLLLSTGCRNVKRELHEKASPAKAGLSGTLTIFHAGSLAVPLREMGGEFMKAHPGVKVEQESGGSRKMIRQITQLGKRADILASADYVAVEQLMFPDHADWHIMFAANRMVLAYTDRSRFGDEIDSDNWYEILLRQGVEFGRSDHNMDPCGYRALLTWKLAEKHYGEENLFERLDEACGEEHIRPKSKDLVALLQAGELDYAFEYYSVARQHELRYVDLPTEIDLSDPGKAGTYEAVEVEVTGKKPGEKQVQKGEPIAYAVTIPKNAPSKDLAVEWIAFMLSGEGRRILEENFQRPLTPPRAAGLDNVPGGLKRLVEAH